MDPADKKSQDDEYFLQGMIRENVDIDVTRTFLNDSGEGDESLNRGDDSGEVEAWDGGEAGEGEADKGEGDEGEADEGEDDGSGRTLNLGNSGEVYICFFVMPDCLYIYMHILTLFLILALRIEHFFRQNKTRPNQKVG
jgi:hypothetical protein